MRAMAVAVVGLVACGGPVVDPTAVDVPADVEAAGRLETPTFDKAAACASSFGNALTAAFGRFDGEVTAVLTPADQHCTMPNGDHVIVQARMNGAIYRLVVNVLSNGADPDVRVLRKTAPLSGGPWAEGWHENAVLDYASSLGVHAGRDGFTPMPMAALVEALHESIRLGGKVSVFATSTGGSYSHSAHLVHRNGGGRDGALVLNAGSESPEWWLFHFANQSF